MKRGHFLAIPTSCEMAIWRETIWKGIECMRVLPTFSNTQRVTFRKAMSHTRRSPNDCPGDSSIFFVASGYHYNYHYQYHHHNHNHSTSHKVFNNNCAFHRFTNLAR
mmetsp:Transcript_42227/g.88639  ORF Transcript_42227/g.88639 Transcript_42227/m.88639 type:complete len:107 (+) Transcript_42227:35-355(+)